MHTIEEVITRLHQLKDLGYSKGYIYRWMDARIKELDDRGEYLLRIEVINLFKNETINKRTGH